MNPERSIYFKVVGHESQDVAEFLSVTSISDTSSTARVLLEAVSTNAYDAFSIKVCYNYGSYANLQDLCDESVQHSVINAIGECFGDFEVALDLARVIPIE